MYMRRSFLFSGAIPMQSFILVLGMCLVVFGSEDVNVDMKSMLCHVLLPVECAVLCLWVSGLTSMYWYHSLQIMTLLRCCRN